MEVAPLLPTFEADEAPNRLLFHVMDDIVENVGGNVPRIS